VSALSPDVATIRRALHPLATPPRARCWNEDDLAGLLPPSPVDAAVLVGQVPRADGWRVLLTRRTDALRHHAGQVSFPGGRVEVGDADAVAAAMRETREEIGIAASQVTPLGYLDPIATVTGFRVCPVVAVIAVDYVARPDAREVDEVFEVAFGHLMTAANLRLVPMPWRDGTRDVPEFVDHVHPGQRIWGVSAAILLNLRQRLEALE
jgi:8-oxo-dGTP pyrophosphatase MutT (NUDIX family)